MKRDAKTLFFLVLVVLLWPTWQHSVTGQDQYPLVLFEFRIRSSNPHLYEYADLIEDEFEREFVQHSFTFISRVAEGTDREEFLQSHGVEFYVQGEIKCARGGIRVTLELFSTKESASAPKFRDDRIVDGDRLAEDVAEIRSWLYDIWPLLRHRLEAGDRECVLAFCIYEDALEPRLRGLGRTVTLSYPEKLKNEPFSNRYHVTGLTVAQYRSYCSVTGSSSPTDESMYEHVISGDFRPEGRVIDLYWDQTPISISLPGGVPTGDDAQSIVTLIFTKLAETLGVQDAQ